MPKRPREAEGVPSTPWRQKMQALLRDPTADAVWTLLRQRYPDQVLDLDINLSLDLGLDSFGWMELTILLQDRLGIHLSDADIAGIETIRDLLRLSIERRTGAARSHAKNQPSRLDIERWLAPTGKLLTALGFRALCAELVGHAWAVPPAVNWRREASGDGAIPDRTQSRQLSRRPWQSRRRCHGASCGMSIGPGTCCASSPALLLACSRGPCICSLSIRDTPPRRWKPLIRVLSAGKVQVWFPEGWRSPDGSLQRFLPGIGQLLLRSGAPAVPAYIAGAFEALPRGRRIPKFRRITVTFGRPEPVASLRASGIGRTDEERVVNALRQCVIALGAEADGTAEPAVVADHPADPVSSTRQ